MTACVQEIAQSAKKTTLTASSVVRISWITDDRHDVKIANMKYYSSDFHRTRQERRAWRIEKLAWYSLQITVVAITFITLFLWTGLQNISI